MDEQTVALLIGRFQPFHSGHLALLQHALRAAPRVLLVLGTAHQARNAKNPFSWEERAAMIAACVTPEQRARLAFAPLRDYYDDQRWAASVQAAVTQHYPDAQHVLLFGHFKDASSYYLRHFPRWDLQALPRQADIDATRIRQIYFEAEDLDISLAVLQNLIPLPVQQFLRAWSRLPHYAALAQEHAQIMRYKAAWRHAPYAPVFVTVDALVRTAGHVLLIKRGGFPGKGQWALPGGFLDQHESLLQAAIRELHEETGIGVLPASLQDACRSVRVFDHPERSQRGRTISHLHVFELGTTQLPDVTAADDAAHVCWMPEQDLAALETEFFEDHFHMLNQYLRLVE